MSHFTVAVFTDDSNGETIDEALLLFQEYDGDRTSPAVVEIDVTEETRSLHETPTKQYPVDADGNKMEWDDYWTNKRSDNPVVTSMVMQAPKVTTPSFLEFAKDWYDYPVLEEDDDSTDEEFNRGWIEQDAGKVTKVVTVTNPNGKWDWYSIGGRWHRSLSCKPGTTSGTRGEPSWGMNAEDLVSDGVDSCLVADLDMDAMVKAKIKGREVWWDKKHPSVKGTPNHEIDWGLEFFANGFTEDMTREDYVGTAEDVVPLTSFAALKDGRWFQKGEMGWFGTHSEEMTEDQWRAEFQQMVADAATNPTMRITIVDCHV